MPGLRWRLLHVLALATLAITQPLLSLLGDNPTFFTAHGASPGRMVWFALVVALGPALVVGAAVAAAAVIGEATGDRIHLLALHGLTFLFLIQVVDLVPGPWIVPVALATAGAVGLVALYVRHEQVRTTLSVLGATPILFVALFLFVSPTSDLVFPSDVDAVALDDLIDTDDLTDPANDAGATPIPVADRLAARFPSIHLLVLDELPMATLLDPSGEIDRARFPNFARLADSADLFTNATTVGFTTERAVPAILTGSYASALAPVYSRYPENLYTLLGDIYDATEADPLVDLCPASICNGEPPASIVDLLASDASVTSTTSTTTTAAPDVDPPDDDPGVSFGRLLADARIVFGHLAAPDGLSLGLPEIGASWGNFGADLTPTPAPTTTTAPPADDADATTTTTTASLELDLGAIPDDDDPVAAEDIGAANQAFLDGLVENDTRLVDFARDLDRLEHGVEPKLTVIHALFPHVPWRLHANGQLYDDARLPGYFTMWDDNPEIARAGMQRHLLQTVATDRLLGEYLDRLEEIGAFEDSIVIVTADHGIGFVPGERSRGVGEAGPGIAAVPIFVKPAGQTDGAVHDKPVETVDIVPTIAGLLDLDLPWPVDGHDLYGPSVERFREVLHPFRITIPDPLPPARDAVSAEIHDIFGTGEDGNLYARAGLHDRVGTAVDDLLGTPVGFCWQLERPADIPDENGATGFVFGEVRSNREVFIPVALTVRGVLAGTSTTLHHEVPHRVYALGDPTLFEGAALADIALHEIEDGVLRPIGRC